MNRSVRIEKPLPKQFNYAIMERRQFLTRTIAASSLAGFAQACKKTGSSNGIDLGYGDTGLFNYAYALAQLQASFYIQVLTTPYSALVDEELTFITDIRNHAIAHRGFYQKITGIGAIPSLEFDFSIVNFSNRDSVLKTAKLFEDTIAGAYNGAAMLFSNGDNLLAAAKIASVIARHAAYLRDITEYGSFVDDVIIDENGLEAFQLPDAVLATLSPYIISKLDSSHLPTN